MRSRATILGEARQQLNIKEVPANERERLLNLLSLLISGIGDDILRQIADSLKKTLRTSDFLARYGGDEMTLVLSDTDLSQACIVTQKIQDQLLNLSIQLPGGQTTRLSVSGGIVVYPSHVDTAPGLLRAADEALYRAKKHARGDFLSVSNRIGEFQSAQNDRPKK